MSEVHYGGREIEVPPVVKSHLAAKGVVVEPFASSVVLAFTPDAGGETYRLRVLRQHWEAMLAAMCKMTGEEMPATAPRAETIFDRLQRLLDTHYPKDHERREWLRTPLGVLGGKTPEVVIAEGHAETIVTILERRKA